MLYRGLIVLLLSLGLTACYQSGDTNPTKSKPQAEGPITALNANGFDMQTEDGDVVTVIISDNTISDNQDVFLLTGLEVGDNVEVDGVLNTDTNEITATKIELNNDPADDDEPLMIPQDSLDAAVSNIDDIEDRDGDTRIEIEGVIASVAGNAVVVDITEFEYTSADMGSQITVMLSSDFIELGAMAEISVGDRLNLKGELDADNNFVLIFVEIEAADSDDNAEEAVDYANDSSDIVNDDLDDSLDAAFDDTEDNTANDDTVDSSVAANEEADDSTDTTSENTDDVADVVNENTDDSTDEANEVTDDGSDTASLSADDLVDNVDAVYVQEMEAAVENIVGNAVTVRVLADDTMITFDLSLVMVNGTTELTIGMTVVLNGTLDAPDVFVVTAIETIAESDTGIMNTTQFSSRTNDSTRSMR